MDVARKALILGRLLGFSGELEDIAVESLVPDGAGRLKLDRFLASLEQFDAAWAKRVAAARTRGGVLRYRAIVTRRSIRVGLVVVDASSPMASLGGNALRATFDARWGVRRGVLASGVWRYAEAVLPTAGEHILSYPEGNTPLLASAAVRRWAGAPDLWLKHEGHNPTGSFKDRGMTVGVTQARRVRARAVACASTRNTAAALAAYAAPAQPPALDHAPRLAAVQAQGAAPFAQSFREGFAQRHRVEPHTVASAINIGNPVSYERAVRAIRDTNGLVTTVSDDEILEAKAVVDAAGIGCEPASAAALAGTERLIRERVIRPSDRVVAVLTGHVLKDPETVTRYHQELEPRPARANRPIEIEAHLAEVERAMGG